MAKKENNVALVEELQNKIKTHLKLVDDTNIIQNIKKKTFKELSEEEYAAIDKCENQLAAKDDFYAFKIRRYDRKVAIRNPFRTNYEKTLKRW